MCHVYVPWGLRKTAGGVWLEPRSFVIHASRKYLYPLSRKSFWQRSSLPPSSLRRSQWRRCGRLERLRVRSSSPSLRTRYLRRRRRWIQCLWGSLLDAELGLGIDELLRVGWRIQQVSYYPSSPNGFFCAFTFNPGFSVSSPGRRDISRFHGNGLIYLWRVLWFMTIEAISSSRSDWTPRTAGLFVLRSCVRVSRCAPRGSLARPSTGLWSQGSPSARGVRL